jgi:hypothetical protein
LVHSTPEYHENYLYEYYYMWSTGFNLLQNIKDFFLSLFLSSLYKQYASKGWALCCNPPEVFNVAMPDLSVCYFVASFKSNDDFILEGIVPHSSIYRYLSFTLYDTNGLPYDKKNDIDFFRSATENKKGEMIYKLGTATDSNTILIKKPNRGSYYCLVLRWYRTQKVSSVQELKLPTIRLIPQNTLPSRITSITYDEIHYNSVNLTEQFIKIVKRRNLRQINDCGSFLYPYYAGLNGLFPNKDASYMIVSLGKTSSNGIIEGKLPKSHIGNRHAIRFIGLMVCNYLTTETDSSVSDEVLPPSYRIFVSSSLEDATKHGYNKKDFDHLLLISPNNIHPVIIYREVRVDGKGLHLMTSNSIEEAKQVLGDSYPSFKCLGNKKFKTIRKNQLTKLRHSKRLSKKI